jgi:hypothetical protein
LRSGIPCFQSENLPGKFEPLIVFLSSAVFN